MKLRLVKASNQYCAQIKDMLDEWNATGEKIVPYAIRRINRRFIIVKFNG